MDFCTWEMFTGRSKNEKRKKNDHHDDDDDDKSMAVTGRPGRWPINRAPGGANNTNSNFQQVRQNLFMESKVSKVQSENRGRCIVGRSNPNIAFSAAVKDMIPLVKHGSAF